MAWAKGTAKDTLLTSPRMEKKQAATIPWLTQINGLALEVEVLQHQDKGAALRGWVDPSAHLAALDVIPGRREEWGDMTEFSFTQTGDTGGPLQGNNKK